MKNKLTSFLVSLGLISGGIIGVDIMTETSAERLEAKLTPYGMTLDDVAPFSPEKIVAGLNSKPFTQNEKYILEAILMGEIPFILGDKGLDVAKVESIYLGIANKIGITPKDMENEKNLHKIIRNKLR